MTTYTRPPYFPFYPRDFASDGEVEAMSTHEVGAYILLLCKAWHETPPATIPTDDRVLSRWTRVTPEQWSAMKAAVLAPFKPCGEGRLVQGRLRAEYDRFRATSNRRAEAGSKGGKASARVKQCLSPAEPNHQPPEGEDESESPPVLTEPEVQETPRGDSFSEFWNLYPKRVGKGHAEKAWERATKRFAAPLILSAVREFFASPKGQGEFCPDPATWLNAKRWSDDRWAWWGKDKGEALKLREKWIKTDSALSEWRTLEPAEQERLVQVVMGKVRLRETFDPIRQHWEAEFARGGSEALALKAIEERRSA